MKRSNSGANFDTREKRVERVNKCRVREIRSKSAVRRRQRYVKRFSRVSRAVNELNGFRAKAGVKGEFSSRVLGEILDSALRTVNYHLARHLDCYSRGPTACKGYLPLAILRTITRLENTRSGGPAFNLINIDSSHL